MSIPKICENCVNFVENNYCEEWEEETSAHDTCDDFEVNPDLEWEEEYQEDDE